MRGSTADITQARQAGLTDWLAHTGGVQILADAGYQGIGAQTRGQVLTPTLRHHKKALEQMPGIAELRQAQRRDHARRRVRVEHGIAHLKNWRSLARHLGRRDSIDPTLRAQQRHLDRLWHELRITPCSERCANWLLFGVQPKKAHGRLRPGHCKGRVHQKTSLGIGGRRVLVSRDWFGKTQADHRADAHAWVKNLLGLTTDQPDTPADESRPQPPTVAWEMARHDDPDLPPLEHRLLRAISQRIQRRGQLAAARQGAGNDPPQIVSATADVHGEGGDMTKHLTAVPALDLEEISAGPRELWTIETEGGAQ